MPPARALFYVATAAGIALSARALLFGPPPLSVAAGALGGYVALVVLGVCFSRFGMFADVLTAGPPDARGAALSFDDGPDPSSTPKILAELSRARACATFFVIGHKAERHPELVRAIHAAGHAVGVHSYAHEWLMSLRAPAGVRRDLERAVGLVERLTGERPKLFRAPIGHISPVMARVARELDLHAVGWSVRAIDGWSGAKPDAVVARVVPKLRDGAIVLLHDASERGDYEPASVRALPEILAAAERLRLPLVRVDTWLSARDASAE
jgi:peptidoglycan/xylan/chitin deacetylase (PgdA/CDA1 family)